MNKQRQNVTYVIDGHLQSLSNQVVRDSGYLVQLQNRLKFTRDVVRNKETKPLDLQARANSTDMLRRLDSN